MPQVVSESPIAVTRTRPAFFPFATGELVFLGAVICLFMAWDVAVLQTIPRLISRFYESNAKHYWMLVAAESVLYGSIMSQTTILGIWSSLAAGSTLLRILLTTLIVALFCFSITTFWGSSWFGVSPAKEISYSAGKLFILALLLSVQIPLYGLRAAFGWRLVSKASIEKEELSKPQNNLGAIFGYLAFFAFLFVLAQVSYEGGKGPALITLVGLAPVCSFCGVRFLALLTDEPITRPVLAMLATLPVVGVIAAVGYHFATGLPAWDLHVFEGILVAQVVAISIGFATLFAARWFGLRLVTNRILAGKIS